MPLYSTLSMLGQEHWERGNDPSKLPATEPCNAIMSTAATEPVSIRCAQECGKLCAPMDAANGSHSWAANSLTYKAVRGAASPRNSCDSYIVSNKEMRSIEIERK
jgi:hypothetical protein